LYLLCSHHPCASHLPKMSLCFPMGCSALFTFPQVRALQFAFAAPRRARAEQRCCSRVTFHRLFPLPFSLPAFGVRHRMEQGMRRTAPFLPSLTTPRSPCPVTNTACENPAAWLVSLPNAFDCPEMLIFSRLCPILHSGSCVALFCTFEVPSGQIFVCNFLILCPRKRQREHPSSERFKPQLELSLLHGQA